MMRVTGMGGASSRLLVANLCKLVLSMAFVMLLASEVYAQQRLSRIDVEGNRRIESATIVSFTGLTPGEIVTTGQINDAIQNVRASGLFETVNAVPSGGVLTIIVEEFPTVNRIAFEGNARISDDELLPIVRSQPRRVYNPAIAEQDAVTITQAYADQGRISATVTPKIIRRSDNRVDLIYEITEGGVVEIERISFVGNRTYSDTRLRRVLETKQAGIFRTLVRRDTFVEDRIEFDKQVLRDFYNSRGYVDFRTVSVTSELTSQRDGFFLTFNVIEGQQFRFGAITASSALADVDADEFMEEIRLNPGSIYTPVAIENNIDRLENLALSKNLNFIRVTPRISRNDRDLTLDVDFEITRGPRVFVERIDIEGNTTTLDRVIRRQFRVVEGDPFNPREIRQSAERIRSLGYFSDAQVNAREGSTPQQVVIDVDVVEQPTGSFSFGGNFSSEDGIGLIAEFSERNFLGRGQTVNLSVATGRDNRRLSLRFVEPAMFDRNLAGALTFRYGRTDDEDALYDTSSFLFSPTLSFPVSERGRLRVGAFYSTDDLFDVTTSTGILLAEGAIGKTSNVGVTYNYSFDNRRSGLDPRTSVIFRFGQDFFFGDSQYIRTTAFAAAERLVLGEEVTLRATLEGGALAYTDGTSRVTDRFFLNSRTFRGFTAQGIGPRERNGIDDDALGGEAYAVARLEAEFPIGLPEEYGISGGLFFDYGSVWDVGNAAAATGTLLYDDFTPRAVVGFSIFWSSPLGPLRFNFTEALQSEEFDEEQNFDLTISTQF